MTYGSGGWDDQQWGQPGYAQPEKRGPSGAMIAVIALLGVVIVLLAGLLAYFLLRPDGATPGQAGQAAAGSSSSSPQSRAPWSTPQQRDTVTVTPAQPAPPAPSSRQASTPRPEPRSAGHPAGADRSGWTDNRQSRCNAGDPAAMIGRTTQASFSICINPDNGRYYYRGSSGGAGVEVDDPVVSGRSATVSNNNVVYAIDASEMVITEGGRVISTQPMVDFWVG